MTITSTSTLKQAEEQLTASAHKTAALVSTNASALNSVSKRVAKLHTTVNQVKAGAPAPTETASLTLEQKIDVILAEQLAQKAIIGRLNYTVAQELQKLQTQQGVAADSTSQMHADLQAQITWLGAVLDAFHADTVNANNSNNNVISKLFKRKNKNKNTNTNTNTSTETTTSTTTEPTDVTETTDPASTSVAPTDTTEEASASTDADTTLASSS